MLGSPKELLGVDFGATRIRMALSRKMQSGSRLIAVACRETRDYVADDVLHNEEAVAEILRDLTHELGVRRAPVVCALPARACHVSHIPFPSMTALERRTAAEIQARQYHPECERIAVCLKPADDGRGSYVVGSVSRAAVVSRVNVLRKAHLRPVWIEHEGQALARLYSSADAILDIGGRSSSLHLTREMSIKTTTVDIGSDEITHGIAQDLGLTTRDAERRKRILGSAGSGDRALHGVIRAIRDAIFAARASGGTIQNLAVVGSGSRMAGLREALESSAQLHIGDDLPQALLASEYPIDVLRAARCEWSLCVALSAMDSAA